MTVWVEVKPTPDTVRAFRSHADWPQRLRGNLSESLERWLSGTEAHLKMQYLRGGSANTRRDGRPPLAVRSGALLGGTASKMDGELSGRVGVMSGAAAKYAAMLLGDGETTITPRSAKHLWIPAGQNLTKSGQTRMSPRAAMELRGPRGGRLLSIFKSRRGNLIAALRNPIAKRGKNKGKQTYKLMFVLKDSVTVKGTDALAMSIEDQREALGTSLMDAVRRAWSE